MSASTHNASITTLPDPLLGHILALAGRECGTAITLVSRRFLRTFYDEPQLWRQLQLINDDDSDSMRELRSRDASCERTRWQANKLRLLERVKGLMAAVSVSGGLYENYSDEYYDHLEHTFADVAAAYVAQPSQLDQVEISWGGQLPAALSQALLGHSGLTALYFRCSTLPTDVLCQLTHLQRLEVSSASLDALMLELPRLRQLTSLGLAYTYERWRRPALQDEAAHRLAAAVMRLPQLAEFRLDAESLPKALARALPRIQLLRTLGLLVKQLPDEAAGPLEEGLRQLPHLAAIRCRACALQPSLLAAIGQLTQLTLLSLEAGNTSSVDALASRLGNLPQLTRLSRLQHLKLCSYRGDGPASPRWPPPAAFPSLQSFSYGGKFEIAGASFDMATNCPDGNPFGGPDAWPGSPAGQLKVSLASECQTFARVLPLLVPPCATFRSLSLRARYHHDGMHGDLRGCTQLSSIKFASLPDGPWLRGLEELSVQGCTRLPATLAAATQLRHLDLGMGCWISQVDVDRVLKHMQLTTLKMNSWSDNMTPDTVAHLLRSLPLLRAPVKW